MVTVILIGSAMAFVQSLRRIAMNAAASALVSAFYVAFFLGVLPISDSDSDSQATVLALVTLLVAVVLTYLLFAVLGLLKSPARQGQSMLGLGGVLVVMLFCGWFLSATDFLMLCTSIACLLGLLALAVAIKAAMRGDRLARAVVFAICCMLVALETLSLIALDRLHTSWLLHSVSALAATLYMTTMAWVLCSRYFYLIELHKLMAYGPSYDPVTRMRSHAETGQMVSALFRSFRDKPQPMGVIVLTIANLYALEQLYGMHAVNHALFVCAGRLRRIVPSHVEMGRLGNDGFVLILPHCKESFYLIDLAKTVQARLGKPVSINASRELETFGAVWAVDMGAGVLMVSNPEALGSVAIATGRRMSRTALSYASRIAWFDHSSGETVELPDARLL
jgi:GGDEF domain-containing protein